MWGQVTNTRISQHTHSSHHTHVATTHTHHIGTHAHHVAAHWHVHTTHRSSAHGVHAHIATTTTAAHATPHITTHHAATVEVASKVVHAPHGVAKVVHRSLCAIASHVASHVTTSRREVAIVLVAHTAASIEVSSVIVVIPASVIKTTTLATKVTR